MASILNCSREQVGRLDCFWWFYSICIHFEPIERELRDVATHRRILLDGWPQVRGAVLELPGFLVSGRLIDHHDQTSIRKVQQI